MGLSFSHLIIILIIVLVVFGAGKMPQMMSDMGKGLKAFKNSVKDEDDEELTDTKSLPKSGTSSTGASPARKKKAPAKKATSASSSKAEAKSDAPKAKRVASKAKNKI